MRVMMHESVDVSFKKTLPKLFTCAIVILMVKQNFLFFFFSEGLQNQRVKSKDPHNTS